MEIYQAVGQNIHRIRKAQQLSIDRAAALSGVSKSMLAPGGRRRRRAALRREGHPLSALPL